MQSIPQSGSSKLTACGQEPWGSEDFGHMVSGSVAGVARPKTAAELRALVSDAHRNRTTLTPRGGGNSQSGQSVCARSVCLDLREMREIGAVDTSRGAVTCEPGATWRELLAKTCANGWIPNVMPLNLDLTVGGTLALGGFGSASHRFGPCVSNVIEAEVVTGEGALHTMTPTSERELFDATLGGLGRCAVLASAKVKLRPMKARVRTWFLFYEDLSRMIEDQRVLAERGDVEHMEGLCSATLHGLRLTEQGSRRPLVSWSYCLQVSKEYEGEVPDAGVLLYGLGFKRILLAESDDTGAFCARYDVRFELMKATGAARQPHPWLECILPYTVAKQVIPQALAQLPAFLGDLHRVTFLAAGDRPRSLVFPSAEACVAFAVLPAGVPPALLRDARDALKSVEKLLLGAGGKRYLSGWLDEWGERAFREHFGSYFRDWQNSKLRFDPHDVLTSALFDRTGCQ